MREAHGPGTPVPGGHRPGLRADCGRCFGLCCVAPAFAASADFAIDKDAGQPCPNLRPDFRCSIHDRLRTRGFPGCAAYDCFGAGQKVAQVVFGGQDWRRSPDVAGKMFEVFAIVRQLHQMLWYLSEAAALPSARGLRPQLRETFGRIELLTCGAPDVLAELDVAAHRRGVDALLLRASELARAGVSGGGTGLAGADLAGRDLTGARLKGASLRGACLIGADLTGADLRLADLTGADLRGADLTGADLSTSIFLTQPQLDAAKGDLATKVPPALARPAHWPGHG